MEKIHVISVLTVIMFSSAVSGAITIDGRPKCGEITCKLHQYCSTFERHCQDCSVVCSKSNHNYDETVCETQCQDFLHDLKYLKKDGNEGDLKVTVDRLSRMVTVSLTLIVLMLTVLACLLCFQLYRWKVKKNITIAAIKNKFFRKSDSDASPPSNTDNKKRDLRLEMPSPTVRSDHSPVTVSTSLDRRPAEDSALDYAYDNPVMTKSNNRSF